MAKKLKILISGGSGFLGGHLLNTLSKDHFVYALNRSKSQDKKAYPVFVPTDWGNINLLAKTMEGQDAFVHCAGLAHGKTGDMMAVNHDLTLMLANAALKAKLPHFIFISTVAVLGSSGRFNINSQPNPYNDYAEAKLKAEQSLYRLFKDTNTELTIIRPPTIIGRDAPGHAATICKVIDKKWPLPFAGLKAQRSYVTLSRMTQSIKEAVECKQSALMHVSSGQVTSADLIRIIADENDLKARLFYVPKWVFKIISCLPPLKTKLYPLLNDHIVGMEKRPLDS